MTREVTEQEGDPNDGLPTITRAEKRWARTEIFRWLRHWGWTMALPVAFGVGGYWSGASLAGRSCLSGLSFDILGVCVLALPLLNLNEIRWRSTIGGLGRERREALQARYQGYIGLALAVLGFVLQGIGVITSVGVAAP
jgi:hypothetical protein